MNRATASLLKICWGGLHSKFANVSLSRKWFCVAVLPPLIRRVLGSKIKTWGPSMNDVTHFLRFLNPPSPLSPILLNRLMGLDFWSSTWLVDNILSTYIGYPLKKVLKPPIKSCSCVNFGIKPTKISFFILYVCILFVVREKN